MTTLDNPDTFESFGFNTFTAPAGTTLDAGTTYWITVNEGISSDRLGVGIKSEDDQTGLSGWSVGDGRLYRTDETDSWSESTSSIMLIIKGTLSSDAKLSDLALEGAVGGEFIKLNPTFDTATETYTATVANRIDTVTLTATKSNANATVVVTDDDDDTGSPEEAVLDLSVGSNTLTVTVTAQNGIATKTYTVTVERLAAPPPEVTVPNDWALIPPASGLVTGDKFRLLFLSSTKRNAASDDIAVYNTWIQNRAAAGHDDIQDYSTGFRVVGCTAAVDARDNTGTNTDGAGVPIYWLNGNKVADDNADFYNGNWDDEANDKDESGEDGPDTSQSDNFPFTGCDHDGTESIFSGTSLAFGTSAVRVGRPNASGSNNGPLSSISAYARTETRLMYGLSQVFVVAAADPEPPGAPRSLNATGASQTRINLSWNAPDDDGGASITGYRIEVSDDDESTWSDLVADTGSASRTYSHTTGLEPGDTRHYRVYASNSVGEGPESNTAMARTQTSTDLDPPNTMYIYFTESSSNLEESDEVTNTGNHIEGDCSGQKYFRGYWTEPNAPVADEWEVRVSPRDGASFSGIRVRYSNGNREHPEFTGRARFATGPDKHSYLIFEVRGRYGNDWSAWGPRSGLYCKHKGTGGL